MNKKNRNLIKTFKKNPSNLKKANNKKKELNQDKKNKNYKKG